MTVVLAAGHIPEMREHRHLVAIQTSFPEEYNVSMLADGGWDEVWARMTDEELESTARDYIWLAGACPEVHASRHDEALAEAVRRGKPEILSRAKADLLRSVKRSNRGRWPRATK